MMNVSGNKAEIRTRTETKMQRFSTFEKNINPRQNKTLQWHSAKRTGRRVDVSSVNATPALLGRSTCKRMPTYSNLQLPPPPLPKLSLPMPRPRRVVLP